MPVRPTNPYLPGWTRTILIGPTSGIRTPSSVRLVDCQVKLSVSSGVMTLTAEHSLPSAKTPLASITHFEPSLVHWSLPKLPWASKCQETMRPSLGFQPMICSPLSGVFSPSPVR